jgi:hypothetical protein
MDKLRLKKAMEQELEIWAEAFLQARTTYLLRQNISASGELIDSLGYQLDKSATEDTIRLLIAFNDYGRIIDMRRVSGSHLGESAVQRVEDWIRDKGLLRKWIPAFMKKYRLRTIPQNIINRMAWGVLVKRTNAWKPKRWYNEAKGGAITDLYNQIAEAVPDEAIRQISGAMSDREYKQTLARFRAYAKAKGR